MAYQARTTSQAIRLNNSYGMVLPAFALLRVRLEQTIVCSYLLHEDEAKGIGSFIMYTSIKRHKNKTAVLDDPLLRSRLRRFDTPDSKISAEEMQASLKSDFNPDTDKFQREWTDLDLRSMARRRDKLVASGHRLQKLPLERDYLAAYKLASSVVHSDCLSYSYEFLDYFDVEGRPTLLPVMHWGFSSAALCAYYDILQFYEVLTFLKVDACEKFDALYARWLEVRDQFMPKI
jgi:hypothetical protein